MLVAALGACGASGDDSGLRRAQGILRDTDRFSTANGAAEALADAAQHLLDDGRGCENDTRDDLVAACDAVLEAAAYVQVLAVTVLGCRLPDVGEARQDLLDYLVAVESGPPGVAVRPAVPRCS